MTIRAFQSAHFAGLFHGANKAKMKYLHLSDARGTSGSTCAASGVKKEAIIVGVYVPQCWRGFADLGRQDPNIYTFRLTTPATLERRKSNTVFIT